MWMEKDGDSCMDSEPASAVYGSHAGSRLLIYTMLPPLLSKRLFSVCFSVLQFSFLSLSCQSSFQSWVVVSGVSIGRCCHSFSLAGSTIHSLLVITLHQTLLRRRSFRSRYRSFLASYVP